MENTKPTLIIIAVFFLITLLSLIYLKDSSFYKIYKTEAAVQTGNE